MLKYAVELTKGNNKTIIRTFETKDAAMEFGKEYFEKLPKEQGIVSCIKAEINESGQRVNNTEWVYHVWY